MPTDGLEPRFLPVDGMATLVAILLRTMSATVPRPSVPTEPTASIAPTANFRHGKSGLIFPPAEFVQPEAVPLMISSGRVASLFRSGGEKSIVPVKLLQVIVPGITGRKLTVSPCVTVSFWLLVT